jgi:hypothetical protein
MFISPPKLGKDWIYDVGKHQLEISREHGLLSKYFYLSAITKSPLLNWD